MYLKNDYVLTIDELIELLGIGRNTAYRLLNSGELKGFRIGNNWRVTQEAVNEYIINQQQQYYKNLNS